MLTPKQLRILSVFARKPFAKLTRSEIKLLAKEKSNNALSGALRKFSEEKLVTEKKVGRSSLFTLNFGNERTAHYLALAQQPLPKVASMATASVIEEVEKVTRFYTLVVFGSHAAGEQREKSDLDIAVIIESAESKRVEASLNSAALLSPIELDAHAITKADFLEMLTNDEENLGKEIARKHIAIHNPHLFYGLVMEGIRHGFQP